MVAVVKVPVEQAEHRKEERGKSRDDDRARAALFLRRRRVRLARALPEERRVPAPSFENNIRRGRRSDRGVLSFGDFSLHEQRKVTCRGSATHKLIY